MSDANKKNKTGRLLHLDIMRILAIYLVVFNHTGDRGYMLFASEVESFLYFSYMMCSILCKIAVPIFFMVSGALLLPKQEPLKRLFSKRILRMTVVLVLISVPYYFWLHRLQGIDASSFFTYIYGNSASTSLWYLYSYIGLLLLCPFLRNMVKNMNQNDYIYLIVGHIAFVGILPCLEFLLWEGNVTIHESFAPFIFISQNVFFALVGYYLEHVFDNKKYGKNTVYGGMVLSVLSLVVSYMMTDYQIVKVGVGTTEQLEMFFNSFICIPSMTAYLLIKRSSSRIKGQRIQNIISILGGAVFGVYLIEKFLRSLTNGVYMLLLPFFGSFIAALIWCFATCCVAFLIIVSLKHIPIIKKLVNKFI